MGRFASFIVSFCVSGMFFEQAVSAGRASGTGSKGDPEEMNNEY